MGYIILLLSILCHGSSLKQLHIVMVEGYPWHPPVGHGGFQPPLSSDPFNPGTHPARCPWCNVAILSLSHYVYPSMHHSKHHLPSHLPFIDINIMSHQLTLCLCLKFWNISEFFHFFPPFIYSTHLYTVYTHSPNSPQYRIMAGQPTPPPSRNKGLIRPY